MTDYPITLAREAIVVDAQCALHGAMRRARIGRRELADRMERSLPFVQSLFDDEAEGLTLRTLAEALAHTGHSIEIVVRPVGDADPG